MGRSYDAASLDGCAFFECDELVGTGSKRKRKRRVLCVTPLDVLSLVEVKERGGGGGGGGGSLARLLHVKSKLPLRNVGAIAFKDRHNVSLDLTAAAASRLA